VIPLEPIFVPAQIFHIVGSVLSLFGFTALYLRIRALAGRLGFVAYLVAILGSIAVFGDGILGLVVFPELAQHAPDLTSPTGPMFTGRVLGFYIGFFATNMVGMILFGVALIRSSYQPRAAAGLLILGGILSNLPPSPTLHLILVAGGVGFGIAMAWLGYSLFQSPGELAPE
jgi:hypothetical protein